MYEEPDINEPKSILKRIRASSGSEKVQFDFSPLSFKYCRSLMDLQVILLLKSKVLKRERKSMKKQELEYLASRQHSYMKLIRLTYHLIYLAHLRLAEG